jgi:ketopantoate hydroxymethyltransferase
MINGMLGIVESPKFEHLKLYANLSQVTSDVVTKYIDDVEAGRVSAEEDALG